MYLNPPDAAVVFCVDEKPQIQALDRTAPVLPLMPGTPERRTHDYIRHGTTNLYAALDVASGNVIADLTARHRAEEFQRFLNLIDRNVPDDLDVHVIVDNCLDPQDARRSNAGSCATPDSRLHFTPTYSSWLNLVERWFAELTNKWLRRGTHRSTKELDAAIRTWIEHWNDNPRPFVWHKTAGRSTTRWPPRTPSPSCGPRSARCCTSLPARRWRPGSGRCWSRDDDYADAGETAV